MPQKNVKKLIKKEVKKQERKQHGGKKQPKRVRSKRTMRRVATITKGAGGKTLALLNNMASGASAERRAAIELAKAICVPNMFPSFAVQDGFQSLPVGAANPYMVNPMSFSATAGGTDALGINNDESWIFAFRDPHRCLVYYDAQNRTFEYAGVTDGGSTTNSWAVNAGLDFDVYNYTSGTTVYGTKLYTGIVMTGQGTGQRFIEVNKLMYIKISGLAASTAITVTMQVLINDEIQAYTLSGTSSAGGVATLTLSTATPVSAGAGAIPNFFRVGFWNSSLAITNGTFSIGGAGVPVVRQYSLAQFDQLNQVVEKIRFSSLNVMFSNTAQLINKGGFGAARQMPSNLDYYQLMLNGYDSFSTKPEAVRMEINNGIHIFYKSADISDWSFQDVGDPVDNTSGGGNYIIDSEQDYLAISMSQPVTNERGGYVSVFTNVEYRHNSVWFPLIRPNHTRRVFEDALEIIAGIPQVHENPFHIKDIFKWIGQHKGQIQQTISSGASAFGGARAEGYANRANQFLDIWFK